MVAVLPTRLIQRFTLALALLMGAAFAAPEAAFASPYAHAADDSVSCKKKRSKKRRRRARRARARRAKKRGITAKTIKRWQRKGWSNEKIVAKAKKKGYRVTKRERKRLRRYRVRKSLRRDLVAMTVAAKQPEAAKPSGPQPIDIESTIDPNEIDFDSVPPPDGMDMRYADAHRAESSR